MGEPVGGGGRELNAELAHLLAPAQPLSGVPSQTIPD